jgi:hypothetical protein
MTFHFPFSLPRSKGAGKPQQPSTHGVPWKGKAPPSPSSRQSPYGFLPNPLGVFHCADAKKIIVSNARDHAEMAQRSALICRERQENEGEKE